MSSPESSDSKLRKARLEKRKAAISRDTGHFAGLREHLERMENKIDKLITLVTSDTNVYDRNALLTLRLAPFLNHTTQPAKPTVPTSPTTQPNQQHNPNQPATPLIPTSQTTLSDQPKHPDQPATPHTPISLHSSEEDYDDRIANKGPRHNSEDED